MHCQFECFSPASCEKCIENDRKNIHGTLLDTMLAKRQQASLEVTRHIN
jgi:hypothetical protein